MVCPTKLLYHIPCPGCGLTRATLLFLRGEFYKSILTNPNVVLCVAFLIFFPFIISVDMIFQKQYLKLIYDELNKALHNKIILLLFVLVEVAVWLSNIINGV